MNAQELAVLIVDDRSANLFALEKTLAEAGAQIVKAESGKQALAATLERDFALAILDVQMPVMDGYELAELLRGNPETHSLPIIFLTAASSEDWQIFRGYETGAVDYIVKPYHPTVLLSKVRVFLEMHTQRRELERNRERLAAINRELEAFAFSVSHDLRAPVEAIEGFGQALVEDQSEVLDEQGKDYLNRIVGESRRMSKLIDALLRLSRIARTEITWQKVDISSQAQEIVTRLRESEPARSAEVSINENLEAVGDPQLLAQLLENLVSNAWKFTAKNERTYIEIGRTFVDGRPAFFVRDNGVGFDMRYADKLFAPFQRLHSMKEFPGTGIGLSTVQRIAARHGGRVWFNSALGEGSTFYFALSDEATGNL